MKARIMWGLIVLISSLLFVGCGTEDQNNGQAVNVNSGGVNPVLVRIVNTPGGFPDTVTSYQVIVIDPATGVQVGGGSASRDALAAQQDIVVATGTTGTKTIIVQALNAAGQIVSSASSTVNVPNSGQLVFNSNQFTTNGVPTASPGASPFPTPSPSSGASPSASPSASPGSSPSASPGGSPSASPNTSPLPGVSPLPSPGTSPLPGASPLASPGTSPLPGASPLASPTTSPLPVASPLPSPTTSPLPGASPLASPTTSPLPGASPTTSPLPGASPVASPII